MDTALCWKAFEDDFIWLHGKSEGGLRAEGGRKGDDDKWRCQLAAAIYLLWSELPGNEQVGGPTAALRHYGCEKPPSGDQNKVRELKSSIRSMPNWESVVARPPSAPRARQCLVANQRELQQADTTQVQPQPLGSAPGTSSLERPEPPGPRATGKRRREMTDPMCSGSASEASETASTSEADMEELLESLTPGLKVRDLTAEERLDTLQKLTRLMSFVHGHSYETFEQLERDMPFIRSVTSSRPDVPDARDATIVGLNNLVCTMLNGLSRVPWPEAPAQKEEPRTDAPIDVLIIVCSPGCAPLPKAFDEAHALASTVRRAGRTAHILERGGAAAINALLQERSPPVVWFIGHGDGEHPTHNQRTLVLTAEDGSMECMLPETLANIFGDASRRLELVVLNSCKTAVTDVGGQRSLCEAISQKFGKPTIGWSTLAADTAAQVFAIGLMGCLAPQLAREPPLSCSAVADAFEAGKRAIAAVSRPRTAAGDRTDAWAITDPAKRQQLPGGAWAAGVPVLLAPLPPALLDGVPPIPEQYEPRPALEAVHRAALLRSEGVMAITAATTGISGQAGVGKSTMATVLARDPLVHARFPDGVTWLAFGRERTGAEVLRALAWRLGVSVEAGAQLGRAELASAVGRSLAGQRRLLVLDDIWTREQLRAFNALTAEGGLLGKLVTTRSNELAGEHGVVVASLEEEEGLRVLAGYMGRAAEELRGEAAARRLVALCCGNPAQLRSVAGLCRSMGAAPALEYLEKCREALEDPELNAGEYGTLFDALGGTIQRLGETLAQRCTMLAVLPEDSKVPLSVVGQLWGTNEVVTEKTVRTLKEWHLIDVDWRAHTVSLIDLHLDYLRTRAKNDLARWHAALLRGCGRRRLGSDEGREDDSYWGDPIKVLHHLTGSGEELAKQGGCKQVKELCLRGVEAQQLTEVLPGFSGLKTLDLSNNQLRAASASAIASVLKTMQISSLNIGRNHIGVEGVSALAAILKETQITHLSLADNELCGLDWQGEGTYTAEGITKLCEGLKGSAVTSLNLTSNVLCGIGMFGNGTYTTEGITKLCEALKGSAVTSLNLGYNEIGAEGASTLAAVLKETQITTLGVDGHPLQIDELKGTKPTEKIVLSRKGLAVPSAIIIASCIKENGVLKELNVDGHALQIDDLKGTKPTEKIDLSRKGLRVASAIIIASWIKENGVLKELNVGYNDITGDAAENLATAVLEHASMTDFCGIPLTSLREDSITELDLKHKGVGEPGAIVLSKLLPSAAALTSLNLFNNDLGPEGGAALAEGLKGNSTLQSLNVLNNSLGNGADDILSVASEMPQIITLCGIQPEQTDIDFSSHGLNAVDAKLLAFDLSRKQSVRTVNLLNNSLGDGADAILSVASEMPQIITLCGIQPEQTDIDFSSGGLDAADAKLLAFDLSRKQSVRTVNVDGYALQLDELRGTKLTEKIDLSNRDLGVASAIIIASCIKENRVLKELNLAGNKLCGVNGFDEGTHTTEGITKLCEGLKGSAMTSLNLECNALGPEGGAAIAEGLKGNSTLQSLNLGVNKLCGIAGSKCAGHTYTTKGITKLCKALKGSAVTSLNLQSNNLGPKGGATLAKGLKGNSTLRLLE